MSDVKLLATWDGWCDPCGTERPLVLVEIGPRGVRAFFGGVGIDDRTLNLTCRVCGQWQAVPQHEEDDELEPIEQLAAPSTPVAYDPLAIARATVRTARFDGTEVAPADPPARRASDAPAAEPETPAAEIETATAPVAEVEVAEAPAAKALARWFDKKAVAAEQEVLDEAVLAIAEDEAIETPKRSRWFATKAVDNDVEEPAEEVVTAIAEDVLPPAKRRWFAKAPQTEVEEIEVAELEEASDALGAPIAEDEAPVTSKRRWFAKKTVDAEEAADEAVAEVEAPVAPAATAKVPAILSVAVRPTAPSVAIRPPAPRAVAPDAEEPVRPAFAGIRPTSVGPSAQTRQIPVPRTQRSTVRAASATDTSPLALLAAGYDVVAAGSR